MNISTGLSAQIREEIGKELNHFLADIYTLYLQTQKFHWNVKGMHFYSLHLLFEKQYEELSEEIDEVAERIQALGVYVEASLATFKKQTSIQEEAKATSAKEMLELLLQGHETVIRLGRKVAILAEKHEDVGTVDMIGRAVGAHEKTLWMLRSHVS